MYQGREESASDELPLFRSFNLDVVLDPVKTHNEMLEEIKFGISVRTKASNAGGAADKATILKMPFCERGLLQEMWIEEDTVIEGLQERPHFIFCRLSWLKKVRKLFVALNYRISLWLYCNQRGQMSYMSLSLHGSRLVHTTKRVAFLALNAYKNTLRESGKSR